MAGKSFFIDTTLCTACRGCQIACKNWNQNGASMTKNTGSHQNPPELDGNTFKLVHFSEVEKNGKVAWYFFAEQCRHCLDPPCKDAIEGYVEGGVIQDEKTGAVVYTDKAKGAKFNEVKDSCPYNIPRARNDGNIVKCTMCLDRLNAGLIPACVKVCPTGAMNFGDREEIMAMAQKRLEVVKAKYPDARLIDADSVRVIYLVVDDPKLYYKFAIASADSGISRKLAMRRMMRPAERIFRAMTTG